MDTWAERDARGLSAKGIIPQAPTATEHATHSHNMFSRARNDPLISQMVRQILPHLFFAGTVASCPWPRAGRGSSWPPLKCQGLSHLYQHSLQQLQPPVIRTIQAHLWITMRKGCSRNVALTTLQNQDLARVLTWMGRMGRTNKIPRVHRRCCTYTRVRRWGMTDLHHTRLLETFDEGPCARNRSGNFCAGGPKSLEIIATRVHGKPAEGS